MHKLGGLGSLTNGEMLECFTQWLPCKNSTVDVSFPGGVPNHSSLSAFYGIVESRLNGLDDVILNIKELECGGKISDRAKNRCW